MTKSEKKAYFQAMLDIACDSTPKNEKCSLKKDDFNGQF